MAEVWKATKRTFADLIDVDSSTSRKPDTVGDTRSRQSTSSSSSTNRPSSSNANVSSYRTNVNAVNTRPATTVWASATASSNSNVGKVSTESTSRSDSNASQSSDILRRTDTDGQSANFPSRLSTVHLGQGNTDVRPSVTEDNELLLNPSQLQLQDQILADSSKADVQTTTGQRLTSQPRIVSPLSLSSTSSSSLTNRKVPQKSEPKIKNRNLHILPSGFSPPRNKTQVAYTSDVQPIFHHSQTVPELGLYPQYASFQPREATVKKDLPLLLPGEESPDTQRQNLTNKNDGQSTSLVVERSSRTIGKSTRRRIRSSSSDRAKEMKLIQRRPSYNKSQTIDSRRSDIDEDDDWHEQAEKVKLKFMSMWNNVKYGWTVKTKTLFNIHKAIWLLGKCYHHRPEDPDLDKLHPGLQAVRSPAEELFKQDFVSRIWLTYRREFPQLSGSTLTTDCGWGCMLRSGQMLLAQSLILHFLGRDWNLYKSQTVESEKLHRQIIQWFGDQPSDMSPFSVHHLVEIGKHSGKRAGDWFGPASVAHIIKVAVDQAPELNPMLDSICIYVSQDCTVYKQDVIDLCTRKRKKLVKPIYHDVPERDSVGSGTGDPSRETSKHSSAESKELLHQQSSSSSFAVVGDETGTRTCNNEEDCFGTTEERNSSFGSGVDKETIASEDSFETVLRQFDSEWDKYSSNSRGNDQDGLSLNDTADTVNSYRDPASKVERSDDGLGAVLKQSVGEKETADETDGRTDEGPSISTGRAGADKSETKASSTNRRNDRGLSESEKETTREEEIKKTRKEENDGEATHSNNSNSPTEEEYSSDWCAVIILVPVRLGGEEVNNIYIRPIQSLFSMTNCIGIIGGKPKHSLYFVGFQDEKLIHLDPHYCQSVVDMKEKDFPIWTFHCMSPRKMAITKMDPSCTIGFYLKTREDFDKFCIEIQQVINPPGSGKDYPMFIIREGRCREWNAQHETSTRNERYLRVRHVNEDGKLISPVTASEDFVLLD
ncbi:hypothetical protein BSL78_25506 [Apostichopus japonicus]|uniref:Cysteine protease n=1 Tax=Stichopus japonicus TaxID=307972 RepID=A0A2G8JPK3_STIJA|nr:hypothetical protein BSL78_25506 [Apostichopus japonicus]